MRATLMRAIDLNSSPAICTELPLPEVAKFISPGRLRARSIRAFTDFTGTAGCTTSMLDVSVAVTIGVKSVTFDPTLSRMNGSSQRVWPLSSSV